MICIYAGTVIAVLSQVKRVTADLLGMDICTLCSVNVDMGGMNYYISELFPLYNYIYCLIPLLIASHITSAQAFSR